MTGPTFQMSLRIAFGRCRCGKAERDKKDHVIMWVKEYSRTIDFLETRKDMQADKVAYLGISWGGFMGGIIPAIEKRIKVVVLNVGGMAMERALPEVDQISYLPRVTQPVLMLNGTYDMYFPVESSQKPMFRLLGTPQSQKRMIVTHQGTWFLQPHSSRKHLLGLILTWGLNVESYSSRRQRSRAQSARTVA